ncbi:MAG: hypothetical protein WCT31_05310 [Candidatus Micrarchaeia archaeon]|jgi:hypothetical protein
MYRRATKGLVLINPILRDAEKPAPDRNAIRYEIAPDRPSVIRVDEKTILRRMFAMADSVPADLPPIDISSFIPILRYEFPLNPELFDRRPQSIIEQMIRDNGALPRFKSRLAGFSFEVAIREITTGLTGAAESTEKTTMFVMKDAGMQRIPKIFRFRQQSGGDIAVIANEPATETMGKEAITARMKWLWRKHPGMQVTDMAKVMQYEMPLDHIDHHKISALRKADEEKQRAEKRARIRARD